MGSHKLCSLVAHLLPCDTCQLSCSVRPVDNPGKDTDFFSLFAVAVDGVLVPATGAVAVVEDSVSLVLADGPVWGSCISTGRGDWPETDMTVWTDASSDLSSLQVSLRWTV